MLLCQLKSRLDLIVIHIDAFLRDAEAGMSCDLL